MDGRPDEEQLQHAILLGLPIYTSNARDFIPLAQRYVREGKHHFGIIINPSQLYSLPAQVARLRLILESLTEEELANQVLYISNWDPDQHS